MKPRRPAYIVIGATQARAAILALRIYGTRSAKRTADQLTRAMAPRDQDQMKRLAAVWREATK